MIANWLSRIACRLIEWTVRLKGTRIVITRPWSGGTTIIFDGIFDGVESQRVHDSRGFVFYVKAKPKAVSDKFQWATPATRPQLIEYHTLEWDKRISAWASPQ